MAGGKHKARSSISVHAVLAPVIYSGVCILFSTGLVISLEQHPYANLNILVAAFAIVAISLGFYPEYSLSYAPMLFTWTFWLAMLTATWSHWNLVDTGHDTPIPFHEKTYYASVAVQLLCGWLTFIRRFRGHKTALVLAILVALLIALVPKPRPKSEYMALSQVVAYTLLYLSSHLLVETFAVTEGRAGSGALKILQSSWVLFVQNIVLVVIVAAVQGLIALALLGGRFDDLQVVLNMRAPPGSHSGKVEDTHHKKHDGSEALAADVP